jgi:hypothetical protein
MIGSNDGYYNLIPINEHGPSRREITLNIFYMGSKAKVLPDAVSTKQQFLDVVLPCRRATSF